MFKIILFLLLPLIFGLGMVLYIYKTQPPPQGKIIPIQIRISRNACANYACEKICTKRKYSYMGYRLIGSGGLYGKKIYECFCIQKATFEKDGAF